MKNDSYTTDRAADKMRESDYAISATDFMTPSEILDTHAMLTRDYGGASANRCFFWGGAVGCERRAAVFLPEWYMPDCPPHAMPMDEKRTAAFAAYLEENPALAEEIPIRCIKITGSGFKSLTHRDFLGGILSLGIDRSVVGDIAVLSECEAMVFVSQRIADFILTELHKIGRDGVKCGEYHIPPTFVIPRRYERTVVTVSSPRLDGIVKAIAGKSREAAAEMVKSGLAELSYRQIDDVSAEVKEGDVISLRGYGKYLVGAAQGETKSGRMKIEILKYI